MTNSELFISSGRKELLLFTQSKIGAVLLGRFCVVVFPSSLTGEGNSTERHFVYAYPRQVS
jgi:hypothetical protein